jgi:hypothetical protein
MGDKLELQSPSGSKKEHEEGEASHDEAGDGSAREGDLGLAGPTLGEILPHPSGDFVFFRSEGAPYTNPLFAQLLEGSARVRQVIKLYEYVHGIGTIFDLSNHTIPWRGPVGNADALHYQTAEKLFPISGPPATFQSPIGGNRELPDGQLC